MKLDRKNRKELQKLIIFTAVIVLAVIHIVDILGWIGLGLSITRPFIIGGAIAFIINIPMKKIESSFFENAKRPWIRKCKRGLSLLSTYVLFVFIVLMFFGIVIPQLAGAVGQLTKEMPAHIEQTQSYLNEVIANHPELEGYVTQVQSLEIDWTALQDNMVSFLKNGVVNMLGSTMNIAKSIFGVVIDVFIAFFFSIYLLIGREKLGNQFYRVSKTFLPEKIHKGMIKILGLLQNNFSNFITGQCLEACILAMIFLVVMIITGIPYAGLIAVLIGFTALVPVVGAFTGFFIGFFLILIIDPIKAVWFAVEFIIIQQCEDKLIYPHVVGSSVGLPSIWVLVAITIGGSLGGAFGMLLSIPIFSTIYSLIKERVHRFEEE